MNILHVTPYYAPAWSYGGVVSAVTGLATAQAARGHLVRVLTTDALDSAARNPTSREVIDQVEVIRCPNLSNWLHARFNLSVPVGFRVAFWQLAAEADIVHCHELRIAENLLIDHRKPIVMSRHGTLPRSVRLSRCGSRSAFAFRARAWSRTASRQISPQAAICGPAMDWAKGQSCCSWDGCTSARVCRCLSRLSHR